MNNLFLSNDQENQKMASSNCPKSNHKIGSFNLHCCTNKIADFSTDRVNIKIFGNIDAVQISNEWDSKFTSKEIENIFHKEDFRNTPQYLDGRFFIIKSYLTNDIQQKNSFEIITDAFGKFEIYFRERKGIIEISDSFLTIDKTDYTINYPAIAHAISVYGNRAPKKDTYVSEIHKLGVNEILSCDGTSLLVIKNNFTKQKKYVYEKEDSALKTYSELFLSSLQKRGSDNGNIVFLSSGWDSTSILAGLVHIYGKHKVKAVTGRMLYSERSGVANQIEIEKATAIAKHYDIELNIVDFDYAKNGRAIFDKYSSIFKHHCFANVTAYNWAMLSELASKVMNNKRCSVFCGETSDAAHNLGFSQSTTIFHADYSFREYSDKMLSYLFGPLFFKRLKDGSYKKDEIYQFLKQTFSSQKIEDFENTDNPALFILRSFFSRDFRFPGSSLEGLRLLSLAGKKAYQKKLDEYFVETTPSVNEENLYSTYLNLYNSFHWQGSTVASLFAAGDHFGFDIKIPFWDSELQNFLSYMPEHYGRGLDLNPTKFPLKHFLKHGVKNYPFELQRGPHSYQYDINPEFNHSAELLYKSGLTALFKETLLSCDLKKIFPKEFFNTERILFLVDGFLTGKEFSGADRSDLFTICVFTYSNKEIVH